MSNPNMTRDNENPWVGVILAAGIGSRMKSSIPKPLHLLCGRTMLGQTMNVLRKAGVERIVIVSSPAIASDPKFLELLDDETEVATQLQPLGTGDALLAASNAVDKTSRILVANVDMPLIRPETVRSMLSTHSSSGAAITLLTGKGTVPAGFGRIRRNPKGQIIEIIEADKTNQSTDSLNEFNAGYYCMERRDVWSLLRNLSPADGGEIYITDLVAAVVDSGATVGALTTNDTSEILGVNDRVELASAEALLRDRIRHEWMLAGVSMTDPLTTYIDSDATIGRDTVIQPNTYVLGSTEVGPHTEIGPDTVIKDGLVGNDSRVISSRVESAIIGPRVTIGPFSHLRPGTVIGQDTHIGNYVELKNAVIGEKTKIGHFSYIGDAKIGPCANIGAGTVTCNYDGEAKHQTVIGANAFIGSGSMLVAPLSIGDRASTGAGAVVTHDVPADGRVAGVPARPMTRPNSDGC